MPERLSDPAHKMFYFDMLDFCRPPNRFARLFPEGYGATLSAERYFQFRFPRGERIFCTRGRWCRMFSLSAFGGSLEWGQKPGLSKPFLTLYRGSIPRSTATGLVRSDHPSRLLLLRWYCHHRNTQLAKRLCRCGGVAILCASQAGRPRLGTVVEQVFALHSSATEIEKGTLTPSSRRRFCCHHRHLLCRRLRLPPVFSRSYSERCAYRKLRPD